MSTPELRQKLEAIIQEYLNESHPDEEDEFLVNWILICEMAGTNGSKTFTMRKDSSIPPWLALGMINYALLRIGEIDA